MRGPLYALSIISLTLAFAVADLAPVAAHAQPVYRSNSPHSCPPVGTWLGLPYLNRFADGNCGYVVGRLTIGAGGNIPNLTLNTGGDDIMEGNVVVNSGGSLTIGSGDTLVDSTSDLFIGDPHTGATFTMQAGSAMDLSNGYSVDVTSGGTFNALGTAGAPVTLTSANGGGGQPGDWGRVEFQDGSSGALDHVILSDAGASRCLQDCVSAALFIGNASVSVTNSTITSNAQTNGGPANGIQIENGASPTLTNDALTDNSAWPVYYTFMPTDLSNVSGLSASGNGTDTMSVSSGNIAASTTWQNPGMPIQLRPYDAFVTSGATWTLRPGTQILLSGQRSVVVESGATLHAAGTSAAPIALSSANGANAQPGDWGGLFFETGSSGTLSYAHVSYAGAPRCFQDCASAAVVSDGANPSTTASVVDTSAGDDVRTLNNAQPVLEYDEFGAAQAGSYGVGNSSPASAIDATHSFWFSTNGPGGAGSGSGTPVSTGVRFSPYISLGSSTTSGSPGATITVSGTGFQPRETVQILFNCTAPSCNGTLLVSRTASAKGTVKGKIKIPKTAPAGSYGIAGIGSSSGGFADFTFSVT